MLYRELNEKGTALTSLPCLHTLALGREAESVADMHWALYKWWLMVITILIICAFVIGGIIILATSATQTQ